MNTLIQLVEFLKLFLKDESGVTVVEYGIMAALIAFTIIAGLAVFAPGLLTNFSFIGSCIDDGAC